MMHLCFYTNKIVALRARGNSYDAEATYKPSAAAQQYLQWCLLATSVACAIFTAHPPYYNTYRLDPTSHNTHSCWSIYFPTSLRRQRARAGADEGDSSMKQLRGRSLRLTDALRRLSRTEARGGVHERPELDPGSGHRPRTARKVRSEVESEGFGVYSYICPRNAGRHRAESRDLS